MYAAHHPADLTSTAIYFAACGIAALVLWCVLDHEPAEVACRRPEPRPWLLPLLSRVVARVRRNLAAVAVLAGLWALSALGCLPWLLYLAYTGHPYAAALVGVWWAGLWALNAWMVCSEAGWATPWTLAVRLTRWLLSSDGFLPAMVLLAITTALMVQALLDLATQR